MVSPSLVGQAPTAHRSRAYSSPPWSGTPPSRCSSPGRSAWRSAPRLLIRPPWPGAATRDENRTACPAKLGSRAAETVGTRAISFQDSLSSPPGWPPVACSPSWSMWTEKAFRDSLLTHLKSRLNTAGYGPGSFPQLMISGRFSLGKANGQPYSARMHSEWRPFYFSSRVNPVLLLLEYVLTRPRFEFHIWRALGGGPHPREDEPVPSRPRGRRGRSDRVASGVGRPRRARTRRNR